LRHKPGYDRAPYPRLDIVWSSWITDHTAHELHPPVHCLSPQPALLIDSVIHRLVKLIIHSFIEWRDLQRGGGGGWRPDCAWAPLDLLWPAAISLTHTDFLAMSRV